jgi:hypothetical protein
VQDALPNPSQVILTLIHSGLERLQKPVIFQWPGARP